MPSALAFIGGGLLEGIGKGLVEDGKAKRERALADLEHKRTLERDEKQAEGRRGLLTQQLSREDERQARGDMAAGERRVEASRSAESVARIGATSRKEVATIAASKPSKATDTTAAEDRIIDRHVQIDENGFETIDHEAAATELESRGFTKAAQAQRRKGKAISDQDIRREAEAQADAEVDEKSTFRRTDAVDFKEDGGSRIQFRARRVREIIAELSGTPAPTTVGEGQQAPRRGNDGSWFIPDPDRPGKYIRVAPPAGGQAQPAVNPDAPIPAAPIARPAPAAPQRRTTQRPAAPVNPALPQQRLAASAAIIDPQTARPGAGAVADKPINAMTLTEIADLIQSRGDSLTPEQLRQVTQSLNVLRRLKRR